MALILTSAAFKDGAPIPGKYTCDGVDVSPPLTWSDAPAGTRSFALIADDPDAPGGTWVHWVLYNLPAEVAELPEDNAKNQKPEPAGATRPLPSSPRALRAPA